MIALIDGDILAYRSAAASENEDLGIAIWQTEQTLERILNDIGSSEYKIYLSGDNNFRYQIFQEYKAHRKDKPKPKHLFPVMEHLVREHKAEVTEGYEADDALGMSQKVGTTIICSIDKDLKQIPGDHYNWVKQERDQVESGIPFFWMQVLTGDSSDGIKGCPGIGPKKAEKAFLEDKTYYEIVKNMYQQAYNDKWAVELEKNARLLWIWRQMNDDWKLHALEPDQKSELLEEMKNISMDNGMAETSNGILTDGVLMESII